MLYECMSDLAVARADAGMMLCVWERCILSIWVLGLHESQKFYTGAATSLRLLGPLQLWGEFEGEGRELVQPPPAVMICVIFP